MGCVCSKDQQKAQAEADNVGLVSKKAAATTEPVGNPVQTKGSPVAQKGALQRSNSSLKNAPYAPLSPDTPSTTPGNPRSSGSAEAQTPEPKRVHYANVGTSEDDIVERDEGTCNALLAAPEPRPDSPTLAEEPPTSQQPTESAALTPRSPDPPDELVSDAILVEDNYSDDDEGDGEPVVTGEFAEDSDFEQVMTPESIARTDYTEDDGIIVSRREMSISKLQVEIDSDDEVEEDELAPRFSFTQKS